MGRHSADRQGPFYRSLVGWFLPWFLVAVVVAIAVWFLVGALGGDEPTSPVVDETASPSPTPSPEPTETLVLASPTDEPSPEASPRPRRTRSPEPQELIVEGINVQILNSTSDTSVDDAIADRLSDLGFRIENLERASREYPRTTVFWSYPEAREAAERLAARFDWIAEPKPDNLSATVAIHVVVGTDEV